ncbi:MAG: ABC transporter permease [Melioribacteraceae bacterium]|nr:ABC transporter permease [Melioribacteraceae bacterium]MCF8262878.1 ABC transporter permease [Melioribacteraceae bacterium]MCF8430894.1 ABC transporter permease [Melioribacteraceae bacterium]
MNDKNAVLEKEQDSKWTLEILPKDKWWDLRIHEIWEYKDLLFLFVRRDFVSVYKQTLLGPIWFFLQPLMTTLIFTVIFGNLVKVSTDGTPRVLFYLLGITFWSYFSECLVKTSQTFKSNSHIFGKVYFPRLIVPLSLILSNLIKFGVHFILFLGFYFYFIFTDAPVHPNFAILLLPLFLLMMAGIGLGFGIIITSLTTRYRDLQFLVMFGVQLLMYATPVVYPLSIVPVESRWMLLLNPMTSIIETVKYAFLGQGIVDPLHLAYSFVAMVGFLMLGLLIFHKVEKNFYDTI